MEIQLDIPYEVEMQKDGISGDDFHSLYSELGKRYPKDAETFLNAFNWSTPPGSMGKFVDERGTSWVKRYANYIYKSMGARAEDEVLSFMGSFLKERITPVKAVFEFAKYSNWNEGDFAERGGQSCWWRANNDSRLGIVKDPRGYSMLFYKDMNDYKKNSKVKGIGRNWLIMEKDYAVTFNGYGVPLSESAKILSQLWGVDYKRADVYSVGSYINKGNKNNLTDGGDIAGGGETGRGYVFGTLEVIAKLTQRDYIDIGDIRLKDGNCCICGNKLLIKNSITVRSRPEGDNYVCRNCSDKTSSCYSCDHRFVTEDGVDMWHPDAERTIPVCPKCSEKTGFNCEVHGRSLGRPAVVWHTKRTYCSRCVRVGEATVCNVCNHVTDKYIKITDKLRLCVSCYKSMKTKEMVYHGKNKG